MIRLDEKQYRAVKKMTRAACANNDCGNCLLLDDGETCVCVQSISYSLLCRYFREAVLPADRQLCEQITRSGETDLKRCAVCGSTFAAGSNRAKYCPDCAAKIRRRQKAESERNRRLRIKITTEQAQQTSTRLREIPALLYGKRGHFACWDSPKPLKIEKGRDETICRILHTTMTNWKPPKPCG